MPELARPPLHRLTPLRYDPAAAWLSPNAAVRIGAVGIVIWVLFAALLVTIRFAIMAAAEDVDVMGMRDRVALGVALLVGFVLFFPLRRAIWQLKIKMTLGAARKTASAGALAVDDWSVLEGEPDGRIVSLVGWVRGHAQLTRTVGGKPCVGLALECLHKYPGLLESLQDFELADAEGRTAPIQVAGGRLVGRATQRVFGDDESRLLVASLDLPPGAVSTGHAFVLRDGDPVMVIGCKTTVVDPAMPGARQAPSRAAVASAGPRPLLIFPIDV